jgi:hypothetical protein
VNSPGLPKPPLKPPQFSLRTLFVVVTLVACISALATAVSPMVLAGILFLLVSIAAHVAGNKLGTTLRDHASQQRLSQELTAAQRSPPASLEYAPTTRLRERRALGLLAAVFTIFGMATGAAAAIAGALSFTKSATPADLVVYGIAGGVLCGFFTFAVVAFLQVLLTAAWEASRPALQTARAEGEPTGDAHKQRVT